MVALEQGRRRRAHGINVARASVSTDSISRRARDVTPLYRSWLSNNGRCPCARLSVREIETRRTAHKKTY